MQSEITFDSTRLISFNFRALSGSEEVKKKEEQEKVEEGWPKKQQRQKL